MARIKQFHEKQCFNIDVHVWDTDVGVFVNMTEEEVIKKMRKWGAKEVHLDEMQHPATLGTIAGWNDDLNKGTSPGRMCVFGGSFVVLMKTQRMKPITATGVVIHEMTHVAQHILRKRRTPLIEETEEAHAYLVEFLCRVTLHRLGLIRFSCKP